MKHLLIILTIAIGFSATAQHSTFYIGHSGFGWDLIVGEMVNDLATDAGITTYDYDYQFIGGTCLANQWYSHSTPQGGSDSRQELTTGYYDFVVMAEQIPIQEVINGSQWCNPNILTSYQSVDSFYYLAMSANQYSKVYLMEFHNEIDQTAQDPYGDWVSMNANMRPLWEQVVNTVNGNHSGPEICLVPVAAAFEALADSVIAGSVPGITNWLELFDPADTVVATIHPTEVTYYLVACVHYATIFGQSPVGLTNTTFAAAGWPFDPPTPAQAAIMQDIAWKVVSSDPYTGINPTSIPELDGEQIDLNIYPNPFDNVFTIEIKNYELNDAELVLFNLKGQEIMHLYNIVGDKVVVEGISLDAGLYIYNLIDSDGILVQGELVVK